MAYNDVTDPGNGCAYWTGRRCIELMCDRPAGTAWGQLWCFACNVARMDRIEAGLKDIQAQLRSS